MLESKSFRWVCHWEGKLRSATWGAEEGFACLPGRLVHKELKFLRVGVIAKPVIGPGNKVCLLDAQRGLHSRDRQFVQGENIGRTIPFWEPASSQRLCAQPLAGKIFWKILFRRGGNPGRSIVGRRRPIVGQIDGAKPLDGPLEAFTQSHFRRPTEPSPR